MKRMTKAAALQCPEHVFCEQQITRNMAHPFCIRQYASFQVCILACSAAGLRLGLGTCVLSACLCVCALPFFKCCMNEFLLLSYYYCVIIILLLFII